MLALRCRTVLQLPVRVLSSAAGRKCSPLPPHVCSPVRHQSSGEWLYNSTPVHLAQDYLVQMQEFSGLPWWLNIVVATATARTIVTLPLSVYQQIVMARLESMKPEIKPLADGLRYEVSVRGRALGWTEKQCRHEFKRGMSRMFTDLYIKHNCHPFKASLLVLVQFPLWVSLSLAMRNLSLDQSELYSQLAAGGALWFPDLTLSDSTWIIPVFLGLVNLLNIEIMAVQRGDLTRLASWMTNFLRVFSVVIIPIAASVPASVALYWLTSSLAGLSQSLLFVSPAVSRTLGIQRARSVSSYRDLLAALHRKYFLRKS